MTIPQMPLAMHQKYKRRGDAYSKCILKGVPFEYALRGGAGAYFGFMV